jgi:hypothetical protein
LHNHFIYRLPQSGAGGAVTSFLKRLDLACKYFYFWAVHPDHIHGGLFIILSIHLYVRLVHSNTTPLSSVSSKIVPRLMEDGLCLQVKKGERCLSQYPGRKVVANFLISGSKQL